MLRASSLRMSLDVSANPRAEAPPARRPLVVPPGPQARRRGARALYFALGWLFFALGVAGAILPLLPSTPFMLLASWAFGRSSARFERWLVEHPWFGPGIQRWRAHRVVPQRVKLISYATMLATFALSLASGRIAGWALALQAALMAFGAWFIARLPARVPEASERPELLVPRE